MITQHFLNEELTDFRKKVWSLADNVMKLTVVVEFTALFFGLPLAFELVEDRASIDVLFNMLYCLLTPSFITLPISAFIMIKEKDKLVSIFEKINNTLGENKMEFRYNKKQAIEIKKELREKINVLVELGIKIKNIEHYLLCKESTDSNQKELPYSYLFDSTKPLDIGTNCTNIKGNGLRRILERKEDE